MFQTIIVATKNQELQLLAAKKVLEGEFDQAVRLMKQSAGIPETENPFWVFQTPETSEMRNISEEIGNPFIYQRLRAEKNGGAAAAVLMGHYGSAVQIIIADMRSEKISKLTESLPEDTEEMMAYLDSHPQISTANDMFVPSWIVD